MNKTVSRPQFRYFPTIDRNDWITFQAPYLTFTKRNRLPSLQGILSRCKNSTARSIDKVSLRDDFSDSYKMAAEVAVGAAIVIALAILLALIWNQ